MSTRLGKDDCGSWVGKQGVRSAPRLVGFVVVCLAYFLLGALGAHFSATPPDGHNSVETVHLPPTAGKDNVVSITALDAWVSLTGKGATAQIVDAGRYAPGQHVFDGPGLIAAVATIVAALLVACFQLVCRATFAAFLTVLGVGRWHRSVVLHL